MLILRTSNHNSTSHGGFQWPKEGHVEAPDWDPIPECGKGLHGLAHGRGDIWHLAWNEPNRRWQVVEVDDALVVDLEGKVKFPKGVVTYSGDCEGALGIFAALGGVSVRDWILKDPEYAYTYARYVDKGPRDDTRSAACGDPEYAYTYARYVDKGPRDDTRLGACGDHMWAYWYARDVDKAPRDDTRSAAC